ncbi:pyridoxal-phosphate dependent enzyme [Actinomadura sp. WMMB 499]|uniref:pyridoxal-phosphate dependent enzyme n=1 Tax=Actinomadura sp. WMMB 499 TaxID=1219491 RepID=UPI0020C8126B|nr:pyridoxal-phosphate dependent enzyme [Actinomadura sp. WMMB 499]
MKLKAAAAMVDAAERDGLLAAGSTIVESSSGNLGIALSLIAADRGLKFICVTDPRCNPASMRVMRALGAEVRVVSETDANGGFLESRIRYVRSLCEADGYVWLNQYANRNNWLAHYRGTAPAIDREFPDLEILFVGAGTTGTLMGCARYFREHRRPVTIVAVDAVGSVTFGGVPGPRMVPGLGTSSRPALVDESLIDDVVHVPSPTRSGRPTPCRPAGSCSAARPAPSCPARPAGWTPSTPAPTPSRSPSRPTSASATSTRSTPRAGSASTSPASLPNRIPTAPIF